MLAESQGEIEIFGTGENWRKLMNTKKLRTFEDLISKALTPDGRLESWP